MKLLGIWIGLLLAGNVFAQTRICSGKIMDRQTGLGIARAYIHAMGKKPVGTISNEDGYFELALPLPADSLRVTHVGYHAVKFSVNASMQISMVEATYELPEITVEQENGRQIAEKAIAAIAGNYVQKPQMAKGFYREIIREDTLYLSVAEAVFEFLSFPSQKENLQLRLLQGRASKDVKATRLFEDFHPGGGPLFAGELDIRLNPPAFLQAASLKNFNYTLDSVSYLDERKIYIISFDQKKHIKQALKKGKLYIESEGYAVMRYEAGYSPWGIPYMKHLTGQDKIMAGLLNSDMKWLYRNIEVNYQLQDSTWHMISAWFDMSFAYKQPKKALDLKATIMGELLITERSDKQPVPMRKSDTWQAKDLSINLSTDYNEAFWGENTIIQPTLPLKKIISTLNAPPGNEQPFEDAIWQTVHPQLMKIYSAGEDVFMQPLMKCDWRDENSGPILYQLIKGDFVLESDVRITKASDTLQVPDMGFQVGGLLVRDVSKDKENHVFLGIGTGAMTS